MGGGGNFKLVDAPAPLAPLQFESLLPGLSSWDSVIRGEGANSLSIPAAPRGDAVRVPSEAARSIPADPEALVAT